MQERKIGGVVSLEDVKLLVSALLCLPEKGISPTSSVQTLGVSTVGSRASTRAWGLSLLDDEAPGIEAELFFGRGARRGVCHSE